MGDKGKKGPIAFCPICRSRNIFWDAENDVSICLTCHWNNEKDNDNRKESKNESE